MLQVQLLGLVKNGEISYDTERENHARKTMSQLESTVHNEMLPLYLCIERIKRESV